MRPGAAAVVLDPACDLSCGAGGGGQSAGLACRSALGGLCFPRSCQRRFARRCGDGGRSHRARRHPARLRACSPAEASDRGRRFLVHLPLGLPPLTVCCRTGLAEITPTRLSALPNCTAGAVIRTAVSPKLGDVVRCARPLAHRADLCEHRYIRTEITHRDATTGRFRTPRQPCGSGSA